MTSAGGTLTVSDAGTSQKGTIFEMVRTPFKRQLKVALIPFITFLICAVAAIINHGTAEGSASSGFTQDGKYFLSVGHGGYQETSRERFEAIRYREWIVLISFAGMVLCGIAAAFLLRRAVLPLSNERRSPPTGLVRPTPPPRDPKRAR